MIKNDWLKISWSFFALSPLTNSKKHVKIKSEYNTINILLYSYQINISFGITKFNTYKKERRDWQS